MDTLRKEQGDDEADVMPSAPDKLVRKEVQRMRMRNVRRVVLTLLIALALAVPASAQSQVRDHRVALNAVVGPSFANVGTTPAAICATVGSPRARELRSPVFQQRACRFQ